ncbi:MAG TPA: iron-sulfur cluster assembly accessory protein [Rhodospirillales bacterium]|nr:iron-sulfur cluster assembly accessory protein [Rhodospirillales bacterium]HJO87481.1 iron-sulfur cluster assembly accessory protein [Rhodospirillales bacterium]|tara:strand:- start:1806 stop:2159 length:354 start_codon:yes stop_codon:yes gene_type:complete
MNANEPIGNQIILTDAAIERVKTLIGNADKPVLGLRVGVTTMGCNGHSYLVEYAEEKKLLEDEIQQDGVTIFVDPLAMMYLFGSTMDYVEDKLQSSFVFDNPNEIGRCGCGESFNVG